MRFQGEKCVRGWLVLALAVAAGAGCFFLGLKTLWSGALASTEVIPPGTVLLIRLARPFNSENAKLGERFAASLVASLPVKGTAVIPPGTRVEGRCIAVRKGEGKDRPGYLRLALSGLRDSQGHLWPIETTTVSLWGKMHSRPASMENGEVAKPPAAANPEPVSETPDERREAVVTPQEILTFVLLKSAVSVGGR